MPDVDLKGPNRYQPLNRLTAAEVFDFGIMLAKEMPHLKVRAPVGDLPDEAVTLDGRLLSKKGVAVF